VLISDVNEHSASGCLTAFRVCYIVSVATLCYAENKYDDDDDYDDDFETRIHGIPTRGV